MDKKNLIMTVGAGVVILAVSIMTIRQMAGSGPSRSGAMNTIRQNTSTDDLIVERAGIVQMLNRSHDSPAAKPERVEMLKENLARIEEQLTAAGIDTLTLEPQPEWDS